MQMLGWITLFALVVLALFAVANWSLLIAPASLNLLVLTVEGPLGVILLGATFVFVALFAVYALSLRTSALVETRRHLKELAAQRELAEKAEASRFTALGAQLEKECARMRALLDEARLEARQRTDSLEASLLKTLEETGNSLSANVGQVDDKLNRLAGTTGSLRSP
jgi:uncharacterized integral membrane protein